jgi:hypothetical protein
MEFLGTIDRMICAQSGAVYGAVSTAPYFLARAAEAGEVTAMGE